MRRFLGMLALTAATMGWVGISPAAPPPEGASQEELDTVVRDVVRMLEEGVEPRIILDWLTRSGARPGPLRPNDLIALSRAEAPESLVRRLMDLASEEGDATSAPPAADPGPAVAIPGIAPAAATATSRSGSDQRMDFSVKYRPNKGRYDDVDRKRWDLIVYLDGQPLVWSKGGTTRFYTPARVMGARRNPGPGPHVIRILQEQHRLRSKRKNLWTHEARAYTNPIKFDLAPGGIWSVEIDVDEKGDYFAPKSGPISFRILHDDEILAKVEKAGPDTDKWPALCEDLETNLSEKQRASRHGRRELEKCVRWSDLWTGVSGVPDRAAIRDEMQADGFRPTPNTAQ